MSARHEFRPRPIPQTALDRSARADGTRRRRRSGVDVDVLGAILHFNQLGGPCIASNATIAERAGCHEKSVPRAIRRLIADGEVRDLNAVPGKPRTRRRLLIAVFQPLVTRAETKQPHAHREKGNRSAIRTPKGIAPTELSPLGASTVVDDATDAPSARLALHEPAAPAREPAKAAQPPIARKPERVGRSCPDPRGGARGKRGRAAKGSVPVGRAMPDPMAQAARSPVSEDERLQRDLASWAEAKARRTEDERNTISAGFADVLARMRSRERRHGYG